MPEKVKKPAKPTTNLLQNIRSPRPSQIDENVPKSKHYRSELEPLLGAAITLKCPDWTIFHEEPYTKILLKGASVMKAPSGRCVSLPIAVDHVCIATLKYFVSMLFFVEPRTFLCYNKCKDKRALLNFERKESP